MHLSYIYVYNLFIMLSYVHDIEKDETAKKSSFSTWEKAAFFYYYLYITFINRPLGYLLPGLVLLFSFYQE